MQIFGAFFAAFGVKRDAKFGGMGKKAYLRAEIYTEFSTQPMRKRRHILLLMAMLLLAGRMAAPAATGLTEIKAWVDAGQYERALVTLRGIVANKATAQDAAYNKYYGQVLVLTGDYAAAVAPLELAMRKGQAGAIYWLAVARQHLYDFEGAIQLAERYRKSYTKSGSLWYQRCDSLVAECEAGRKALRHVEDVVIIDSMTVSRDGFLQQYRLGAESGSYVTEPDGSVGFLSVRGDYRLTARGDELLESHRIASDAWDDPTPLTALRAGGRKSYPFLRSDGATLYFASDATPGLGGLDIYVTQYDSETDTYYKPKPLPMPFNSPYDDYALAIDETHQVGWWATAKGAPAGMVTVYLFLVDDDPRTLEGEQPSRARVDRIADTWREASGYADLVRQCMQEQQAAAPAPTPRIVIDDALAYASEADFSDAEAREAYRMATELRRELGSLGGELEALRADYHAADAAARRGMRDRILQQEKRQERLEEELARKEKAYRNLELQRLGRAR